MKGLSIFAIVLLVAMIVVIFLPLPVMVVQIFAGMLGANVLMCLAFILTIAHTDY